MATELDNALLPEELVIAVLHKVSPEIRLIDDRRLAKIFDDAASKWSGVFAQFAWHPQYHYSDALTDSFQALDHGGSIQRDNPASTYFRITEHTAGPYGEMLFNKLKSEEQDAVREIATRIQETFRSQ